MLDHHILSVGIYPACVAYRADNRGRVEAVWPVSEPERRAGPREHEGGDRASGQGIRVVRYINTRILTLHDVLGTACMVFGDHTPLRSNRQTSQCRRCLGPSGV